MIAGIIISAAFLIGMLVGCGVYLMGWRQGRKR